MVDVAERLRNPPFGTDTSERMLMAQAAGEIERLRAWVEAIGALADVDADDRCWMARSALAGAPPKEGNR